MSPSICEMCISSQNAKVEMLGGCSTGISSNAAVATSWGEKQEVGRRRTDAILEPPTLPSYAGPGEHIAWAQAACASEGGKVSFFSWTLSPRQPSPLLGGSTSCSFPYPRRRRPLRFASSALCVRSPPFAEGTLSHHRSTPAQHNHGKGTNLPKREPVNYVPRYGSVFEEGS